MTNFELAELTELALRVNGYYELAEAIVAQHE